MRTETGTAARPRRSITMTNRRAGKKTRMVSSGSSRVAITVVVGSSNKGNKEVQVIIEEVAVVRSVSVPIVPSLV
jgi:transcriptional regulator of NAD metabolism